MSEVQKQALKDLLHFIVDKEEMLVLKDLISKFPPKYSGIAMGILDTGGPALIAAEDKAIDSI